MAELREGISGAEFLGWWAYYATRAQKQQLAELKAKGGGRGRS